MYVNIHTDPLRKILPKKLRIEFGRSENGDFIFDVWHYRIRINFSVSDWSRWYFDTGEE